VETFRLREGGVQFLSASLRERHKLGRQSSHSIWMVHAQSLPVVSGDFFKGGLWRNTEHLPPTVGGAVTCVALALSVLSFSRTFIATRAFGTQIQTVAQITPIRSAKPTKPATTSNAQSSNPIGPEGFSGRALNLRLSPIRRIGTANQSLSGRRQRWHPSPHHLGSRALGGQGRC
jgi:hypothetical protein